MKKPLPYGEGFVILGSESKNEGIIMRCSKFGNPDMCDVITGKMFLIAGAALAIGALGLIFWGSVESYVFVIDAIKTCLGVH